MGDVARLHDALQRYDASDAFDEDDYLALRRIVLGVGRVDPALLDGFIGLFFERHVLDDDRRAELLAMSHGELERAVRHRFKQLVAGSQDAHHAWHALSAQVREALEAVLGPAQSGFPPTISTKQGFSAIAVEQAVAALWSELRRRPTSKEATQELFDRYVKAALPGEVSQTSTREFPSVIVSRLDAHRLARGIVTLLSDDEKDLFRAQLDGQPIERWAEGRGVSRATAYRLLARIKALCRGQFEERTDRTRLEVLDALRLQL
jgi:DNA-directed RNA polymerase specialized sigma24 family protein